MRYRIKKIAAVSVKKIRVPMPKLFYGPQHIDYRFVTVLAEIETKKWPWSKPVTDCEVFTHNNHWNTWRHADTSDKVRKSVARQLRDCLASYMEGLEDGKKVQSA